MLNIMKKSAPATTKTAIQITPSQKANTTVANVAGKVKTGAFGVATGAGIAGTMMLQNEKGIRNRKAREAYHKRVEQVCTVAVGAAVIGAGAAIVQGIFDPVVDMSMLEIEPETYCELHNKAGEFENAGTGSEETDDQDVEQPAEHVEAEIVPESEAAAPASAPKDKTPIVEATATEQPASTSTDPAPVAPQAEQPAAPAPKDATSASAPVAPAAPDPAVAAPTASAPADPAPAPVAPADPSAKQPADPAPKAGDQTQPKSSKNKNANAAK